MQILCAFEEKKTEKKKINRGLKSKQVYKCHTINN